VVLVQLALEELLAERAGLVALLDAFAREVTTKSSQSLDGCCCWLVRMSTVSPLRSL
jgi:hypothetical protein